MLLNLFLFYQVVRPLSRKSVNKYLYLYLYVAIFQHHCWYFTPNSAEKFVLRPVLSTWSSRQSSRLSDGKVTNVTVRVIGEGATGSLVVSLPASTCSSAIPAVPARDYSVLPFLTDVFDYK